MRIKHVELTNYALLSIFVSMFIGFTVKETPSSFDAYLMYIYFLKIPNLRRSQRSRGLGRWMMFKFDYQTPTADASYIMYCLSNIAMYNGFDDPI